MRGNVNTRMHHVDGCFVDSAGRRTIIPTDRESTDLTISRIEALTYGVEDIEVALRYCADFGFEPLETGAKGGEFRTGQNQRIVIRGKDDPGLRPPVEEGSSIREVTWGVDNAAGLDKVGALLASDRDVTVKDGGLECYDAAGYAIAFRVAAAEEAPLVRRGFNIQGEVGRLNHRLERYGRARPTYIAHVVLDLPKQGREEFIAFYIDRLNFRATETVVPTGPFLQCEGNLDHHQLFLCHRSDRRGINHAAFEVRDFDELIEGGNYMVGKGWDEVRPMGRHTVGSNMYRFFASPCGGRFEYVADMDKVTKTHPDRVWETPPPHHIWTLKTPWNTDAGLGDSAR
jgi:hypothetical protein